MRSSARFLGACTLSLLATLATPASAQQALLTPRLNALTTQPINVIIGFYNIEYERVISGSTSLGLQMNVAGGEYGSLFSDFDSDGDDGNYFSADAKLRYYPGGQPLKGFSVAATAGFNRFSSRPREYFCGPDGCGGTVDNSLVTSTGGKLGFELDYNWLLGVDEKFVVAVGVGAKRLIIEDGQTPDGVRILDYPEAYPTARIAIGFAW